MAIFPTRVFSYLTLALLISGSSANVVVWSKCDPSDPFDPCYDNCDVDCQPIYPPKSAPIDKEVDIDQLQFSQNLEHFGADFFLWGSFGYGLDEAAPELVNGGPPPIGVRKAKLGKLEGNIIREHALEQIGHLRVLKRTVGGIERPLMNMSVEQFTSFVSEAFGYELCPPFDPYHDSLSYMLASYIVPYLGLNSYVGANSMINGFVTKRILAGLLGVKAGQDAVIRTYLYERSQVKVQPYNFTVADFTTKISKLRNKLGNCGLKDEGVIVPPELGAERNSTTNILATNQDGISFQRTPAEILRVVYGTGNESIAGGFYPKGANGKIATEYLAICT